MTSPARLISKMKARCTECGDCWLWDGAVNEVGLPRFGKGSARRRMWQAVKGPIVGPYFVGCTCNERRCLNPEHLILRTKSTIAKEGHENSTPARRYLATTIRARANGKLDAEKAEQIRASGETLTVLAERYGVHFSLISRVRCGKSWRPLSSPFAGLGARA